MQGLLQRRIQAIFAVLRSVKLPLLVGALVFAVCTAAGIVAVFEVFCEILRNSHGLACITGSCKLLQADRISVQIKRDNALSICNQCFMNLKT
jgi:hypothetical protein